MVGAALLTFATPSAARTATVTLHSDTRHVVIESGIEFLRETAPLDRDQAASPALAARWQPFTIKNYNSQRPTPFWVRFDLTNASYTDHAWLLEVGWQLLNRVEVYQYHQHAGTWSFQQAAGYLLPLNVRPVRHRRFLFPLTLPSGDRTTIYIRIEPAQVMFLTLNLWQARVFMSYDQQRTLMMGGFFGILIVMMLYNLFLYISTRDSNYLFYVIYVLSIILYELVLTGIGNLYVWDHSPWVKKHGYTLFASIGFLTATLFLRQFLSLKRYGGWLLQLNNVFLVYWILNTIIYFFTPPAQMFAIMNLIAGLSLLAGIVTSVYLWNLGNIQAKYYTIAYLFLYVGTVLLLLGLTGCIPHGTLTQYSQMVGFVVELVLLSLALADRINRESASRQAAQAEALELNRRIRKAHEEKLAVQEQMLSIQRQTNEALEMRVMARTNELQRAVTDLELTNRELSKISTTDPLTKLSNRRYFDRILADEIARGARHRHHVAVAIVDIDHFKLVNDTHGHLIGDKCLRLVAHTLRQNLRRMGDLLARYGGEEFAIILPETPQKDAMAVVDRLRLAISGIDFIHNGCRIRLSVSIGVAGWIPQPDQCPNRLLQAADAALYDAKRSGRNRTVEAIG